MDQTTQHLQPGTLLSGGKYKILRFIGAGGFGCTYEAEFVAMGHRVAIKEFFVSSCCNREASGAVSVGIVSQSVLVDRLQDKFRREAKRLFALQHPGIVRVSDIIEENGTTYYVMDFISGRSLQSIIDHEGPLPQARALRYIGQVMDALEYVHGKNMLHLDIKPDNIMVDAESDRAILIDFGVSKQYDEVDGHNNSTIMGQTPGFAPPEQAGNSIRQFTPAADIYALGATLYCALTGQVPPSSADIISGFAHLAPLPDGTSPAISRAIGRMMQPNATQRPQTISAARALLDGMENGESPAGMENGELKMENGPHASRTTVPATDANATVPIAAPAPVGSRPAATDANGHATANATTPASNGSATVMVGSQPKPKKWLWAAIAAAVIAIGAAVYFLIPRGETQEDVAPVPIDSIEIADSVEVYYEPEVATTVSDQTVPASSAQQPEPEKPEPEGRTDIAANSVMLACVFKPTKEQRFFTQSEWNAVSDKSDYIQLGVGVNYDGHQFIVAKADASSKKVDWAENNDNDVPGLRNIEYDSSAMRDFDGQGNTNKIINAIRVNGIEYPAARKARGYKAVAGDPTTWSLPAAGQLCLIYGHLQAINDELAKYGMGKIVDDWYWSSTEWDASNAWIVSLYSGDITYFNKYASTRVRAVAPVSLPSSAK